MFEYIVTAFKVIVGVITNERLAIAGLVALGLMVIWITFSLIFSFQARFARGAKNINGYLSANGLEDDAMSGLKSLVSKMPSEFQRGFRNFEKNPNSLPSEHIKRFESLDVELSGGVFNQNKSILKTYINFVSVILLVFSLAILSTEEALTGYAVAEALVIPLLFALVAKVIYYVYTAIRQYQYRSAVEEFNDMLDNFDYVASNRTAKAETSAFKENGENNGASMESANPIVYQTENAIENAQEENLEYAQSENGNLGKETASNFYEENIESEVQPVNEQYEEQPFVEEQGEQANFVDNEGQNASAYEEPQEVLNVEAQSDAKAEETEVQEDNLAEQEFEVQEDNLAEQEVEENLTSEDVEVYEQPQEPEVKAFESEPNETGEEAFESEANPAVENAVEEEEVEENMEDKMQDNFKLDFASLLDEEEVEKPKRGRGRPKKEVTASGEFVITNDKEFEDALVRAEKLMRKNEEPLSASQTKRIEKQIKELVDAMTKYKEGK